MLRLKNISKKYVTGNLCQKALDQVSVGFRKSEFVCVLGASGSGKTTLLNIIGGLDRADEGEFLIDGVSVKNFSDRDFDGYRNHSVGFVFQNYQLIPHQSILQNVKLALSIGGVKKKQATLRAAEALDRVGLSGQYHKKPNQLSGGQMQRVALARAVVNDPKILLADEPTGALDTETGIQVMELLKEIAKDRLVIMVTHNPELAEKYATRIIRLQDGKIVSDSAPYEQEESAPSEKQDKKRDKAKMSFTQALALSFDNLKTKKGRTFLTSFAGSVGIIGISLILAISSGVNRYIEDMQRDTMVSYPISIEEKSYDLTGMISGSTLGGKVPSSQDRTGIYADHSSVRTSAQLSMSVTENDLTAFKRYLDDRQSPIHSFVGENGIVYDYNVSFGAWTRNPAGEPIFDIDLAEQTTLGTGGGQTGGMPGNMSDGSSGGLTYQTKSNSDLSEFSAAIMSGKDSLVSPAISSEYEILQGKWASDPNEVMIFLDENNSVDTQTLYLLGVISEETYRAVYESVKSGEAGEEIRLEYGDLIGKEIYLLPTALRYVAQEDGIFRKIGTNDEAFNSLLDGGITLSVCGVAKPRAESKGNLVTRPVAYTEALVNEIVALTNESEAIAAQEADTERNILTGEAFRGRESYAANLKSFGKVDFDAPSAIRIYTDSFEAKKGVADCIVAYNEDVSEEERISYTDYVELMTSSLTLIVNVITGVLVAFTSVSLIVSCLMIGIITRISVLERTREIGILRALGASGRNVSEVFNAETAVIGFISGLLGVGITYLLCIPVNALLTLLSGSGVTVMLSWQSALILLAVSVAITLLGGLAPAYKAAKKDPVLALRAE